MNRPSNDSIAPDGDLVLVIGPQKSRIRAKSALVAQAFPIFRAMLVPSLKKGHALASGSFEATEIDFPEDDPEPFELALSILHEATATQIRPSLDSLYKLACLVDKYDLCDDVGDGCARWLQGLIGKYTQHIPGVVSDLYTRDLVTLTLCSIWLRQPSAFHDATAELMRQTSPPFSNAVKGIKDQQIRLALAGK